MDEPIKIESGIPMPRFSKGRPRMSRYPFREMKPGDSFFVAGKKSSQIHSYIPADLHKTCKFATRTEGDGVRVWRLS